MKRKIIYWVVVIILTIISSLSVTILVLERREAKGVPSAKEIRDESLTSELVSIFYGELPRDTNREHSSDSINSFIVSYVKKRDWNENECMLINSVYYLKSALFGYYHSKGYFPKSLDSIYAIKENMLVEKFKYDFYYRPVYYKSNKDVCIFASMGQDGKWSISPLEFDQLLKDNSIKMFFRDDDVLVRIKAPVF